MSENEEKPAVRMEDTNVTPSEQSGELLVDDIHGFVPTVSATPTFSPRKFIEQLRIKTGQWCFYDNVAAAWTCVGADKTYTGLVNGAGTSGTPFPTGWSVSQPTGTGTYLITHNLGTTDYSILVFPYSTDVRAVNLGSKTSTTIAITIRNSGGTLVDNPFYFHIEDES